LRQANGGAVRQLHDFAGAHDGVAVHAGHHERAVEHEHRHVVLDVVVEHRRGREAGATV
jgi:plasmid stability protein